MYTQMESQLYRSINREPYLIQKFRKHFATGFAAYSARLVQLRNVFSTPPHPPKTEKKQKTKLERQVSKTRKPEAGRIEV